MADENRIWILVGRKLAGEATPGELEELANLLQADQEMQLTIETFYRLWHATAAEEKKEPSAERLLLRIREANRHVETAGKTERVANVKGAGPFRATRAIPVFKRNYMIGTYIKIARRNLVRGKGFSVINITGLALGMASAILILMWIGSELSFDNFHSKKDRIYLAYSRAENDGKIETWNGSSSMLGPAMETDFPGVAATARANWVAAFVFHAGDKHLQADGYITDPAFLQIFDFPLLQGDPANALNSPRSLVITESFAHKLFGNGEAMGKVVRVDSTANFIVTGVLKDLPTNTSFKFGYLLPWSYMKEVHWDRPEWGSVNIKTYALLKPGVSEQTLMQASGIS